MRPLDFIVIGTMKAGTTSLFHYLRHHPELFLPPDKELPYFLRPEWYERGWPPFARRYFSEAGPGQILGTVTPQYMEEPAMPERIHGQMPGVRLIALLRNPIDRVDSYYRMQVRRGRETRSIEQVVEELALPASAARAREMLFGAEFTSATYLVRSEYARILESYAKVFGRDRLLVCFSEDLKRAPQEVVAEVFEFVGADRDFEPPNLSRRYHVGGSERFPGLIPFAARLPPARWLWRMLPERFRRDFLFRFRTDFNVKTTRATALTDDLRARLRGFFAADVDRLAAIIGKPPPWPEFLEPGVGDRP